MIEAAADRTETERRIPADVLAAMHDAGLFHMLLPHLARGRLRPISSPSIR